MPSKRFILPLTLLVLTIGVVGLIVGTRSQPLPASGIARDSSPATERNELPPSELTLPDVQPNAGEHNGARSSPVAIIAAAPSAQAGPTTLAQAKGNNPLGIDPDLLRRVVQKLNADSARNAESMREMLAQMEAEKANHSNATPRLLSPDARHP